MCVTFCSRCHSLNPIKEGEVGDRMLEGLGDFLRNETLGRNGGGEKRPQKPVLFLKASFNAS